MEKELIIFIARSDCPACQDFNKEINKHDVKNKWGKKGFEFKILDVKNNDDCDEYRNIYKISDPHYVPSLHYVRDNGNDEYYKHEITKREYIININVEEIRKPPPVVIDISDGNFNKKYMKYKSKYLSMKK